MADRREKVPEEGMDPEVDAQLARWAERERELVDEASRSVTDEDRRRAARAFDGLATRGVRSRFRTTGPLLIAAAALIAVGFGAYFLGRSDTPDEGRTFLDRSLEHELAPSGETPDFRRFSWMPAERASASYGLRVFSGDALDPAIRVDVRTASYEPKPDELARLGDEIRWEVVLLDETGNVAELWGTASARRVPPR